MPYSLGEVKISAIWLAENQATGQIKLQPDFDEDQQKDILTCYLLPQQNYHTPSMENLLQGSVNTDIVSQSGPNDDSSNTKQGSKLTESVRFAPESDTDDKPVIFSLFFFLIKTIHLSLNSYFKEPFYSHKYTTSKRFS